MTFRVGQKVICIDEVGQNPNLGDRTVIKGRIYTVREAYDWFGYPGIRLDEIYNYLDRGYSAHRFRPVVERKTDISIFTAMLNTSKREVEA